MLEEKLRSVIDKEFSSPDNPVFHYTNEQNYSEISRTCYLKLNSHLPTNEKDPSNNELKTAYQLIIDGLKKHPELKKEVDNFNLFLRREIAYYTLSLCFANSRHCSNKYGLYCIEFNPEIFKEFQETSHSTLFANVIYDKDKQENIISTMCGLYDRSNRDTKARHDLFLHLSLISPFFKSNSYIADSECRVIQTELFSPKKSGNLVSPLTAKKVPFLLREITHVYKHDPADFPTSTLLGRQGKMLLKHNKDKNP